MPLSGESHHRVHVLYSGDGDALPSAITHTKACKIWQLIIAAAGTQEKWQLQGKKAVVELQTQSTAVWGHLVAWPAALPVSRPHRDACLPILCRSACSESLRRAQWGLIYQLKVGGNCKVFLKIHITKRLKCALNSLVPKRTSVISLWHPLLGKAG